MLAQALWSAPDADQAWNFGPPAGDVRTVRWVAERLSEMWPGALRWEVDQAAHPPEASFLALDSSKAERRLAWRPVWDLEQALSRVVEWHDAHRRGGDMRGISLSQLQEFGG
jgi:CDP-glucose 4,6-dehydratase